MSNEEIKLDLNPDILNLKESSTLAINQQARDMRAQGQEVFHYGFGQSPFPVHPKIQEQLRNYAYCKDYLPTAGLKELRASIAKYLKEELNQDFDPELILIGPGSKELIFQALFVFNGPVIIPAPSWVSYKPQVDIRKKHDCVIVETKKSNNYRLQANELEEACKNISDKQKILILNNPNNPSGTFYKKDDIKALAEVCKKHNIVVISDEIYGQITFTGDEYVGFTKYLPNRSIVTGGLSKVFSAGGYRLGFMALSRNMRDAYKPLTAMFSETFSSVCAPVQYAAIKAYEGDPDVQKYVQDCNLIHKASGEYIHKRLTDMGVHCSTPEGSFYVFIDFEKYRSQFEKVGVKTGPDLTSHLLNEIKMALLPGTDFYFPEQSLTARLATVDYNGDQVYREFLKIDGPVGDEFIEKNCPSIKNGMDVLEKYLKNL